MTEELTETGKPVPKQFEGSNDVVNGAFTHGAHPEKTFTETYSG